MSAAKPALVVGVGEGCVPATRRALRRVGAIVVGPTHRHMDLAGTSYR